MCERGSPITVGYEDGTSAGKRKWNAGFQRTWNILLGAGPLQHEVKRNLAIGHALGYEGSDPRPEVIITLEERMKARAWLSIRDNERIVAIGLPAAEPRRRWSSDGYLAMLRHLEQNLPIKVVLFTDDATVDLARRILEVFPEARLAKLLPLPQVAAILSECAVFVGSDSGLGHVATAVECPTVTLCSHSIDGDPAHPTNPMRFRPFGISSVVVQPQSSRAGCEAGCDSNEPHCILEVKPSVVAEAILEFLYVQRHGETAS